MVAMWVGAASGQAREKLNIADLQRSLLRPLELNSKEAATKVLQRRARVTQRWKSDLSHFSALCLDVAPVLVKASVLSDGLLSQKAGVRAMTFSKASSSGSSEAESFDDVRRTLLNYRTLAETAMPEELLDCTVVEAEEGKSPADRNFARQLSRQLSQQSETHFSRQQSQMSETDKTDKKFSRQQSEPVAASKVCGKFQRQMSAAVEGPRSPLRKRQESITMSESGYKVGQRTGQDAELKRTVQGLLNKICPDNVASIVEKIGAVEVSGLSQLQVIIELIFKKAVTEPHYCETYADLVFSLKAVYPNFENPDGGKPVTFKSLVLNICQNEFEQLLSSADLSEDEKANCDEAELDYLRKKRKDRMRANMKFIGHLFLRQLLSAKVIGTIICELLLCEQAETLPEEHALECACELLLAIGYTLENMAAGQTALNAVCHRMKDLKSKLSNDGKGFYCKRVQFLMQDVLDTRQAGWTKKVFKAAAKTKEEIRLEQERELKSKALGKEVAEERVVTGQRPVYLSRAVGA
eukprot:TRINITY_DN66448_c0_g1_i1.p1 TRINITY_DN66448_c0_g1~~TRINITY_DN66448_c0_g1_i1.p1  ORF type:complete len:524 (-),score=137.39 TRINITY_DN66448_c0_g1_i1:67-1638(-)